MDYTGDELEDLARMRALRERLRVLAEAKVAECEAMGIARNWLDMHRQIRAITAADRMIVSLYSPPPRRRSRSTSRQSRPTSPTPPCPQDGTSVPGEAKAGVAKPPARSGAVAKILPAPDAMASENTMDPAAAATRQVIEGINTVIRACAEWVLVWPDGTIFLPNDIGWRRHTLTNGLTPPVNGGDVDAWLAGEILLRCNAIARHSGRLTGYRLDDKPYSDNDPDYFSLSTNFATAIEGPAGREQPAPPGVPWWIVRKPPP